MLSELPVEIILAAEPASLSYGIIFIIAMIFLATKLSGRTVAMILGSGIFLLLMYFLSYHRPHHKAAPSLEAVSTTKTTHEPISELWDKLTRARIPLDEEESHESIELDALQPDASTKPGWVDWPSKRVGNVYRQVVVSDPFSTVEECFLDLEDRFQDVVQVRMRSLIAVQSKSPIAIPQPAKFGVDLDYIMSEICREEYTETVSSSVGDMRRVHVLMEFDAVVDHHLRASWQRYERLRRLGAVGGMAGLAMGGLALAYGLLRFDTWSRGYYTKRLLIGVPAAIIVLVLFFGF